MEKGSFLAVMGRSGSGKSTFLNIIGCLLTPSSGEYQLSGQDIGHLDDNALARIRSEKIGFIFQQFNLISTLNLYDNISLPFLYHSRPCRDIRARVLRVIDQVGLSKRLHARPRELSGGEMQRAAIARALVNDPEIILADEPTGNLDSHNGAIVMDILSDIGSKGGSIILVTHDGNVASRAQKIIEIKDGQIT